jgi:hypothetical protein
VLAAFEELDISPRNELLPSSRGAILIGGNLPPAQHGGQGVMQSVNPFSFRA